MKKITYLLLLSFISLSVVAQKGKLSSAVTNYKSGKLDVAKKAIDAALVHDKTKNNPKVWLYKALIYNTMENDEHLSKIFGGKVENAAEVAFEALEKAENLDKEGKYAVDIADAYKTIAQVGFHNQGAKAYLDEKNHEKAIAMFERKMEVMHMIGDESIDTVALQVIAASYSQLNREDMVAVYYEQLADIQFDDISLHQFLLTYYMQEEDDEKFLHALERAKTQYPDEQEFGLLEIEYYLNKGQVEEVFQKLLKAEKDNPENLNIKLVLGNFFDNREEYDSSLIWYNKAYEMAPDSLKVLKAVANTNIKIANRYQTEIDFLPYGQFAKEDELAKKRNVWFEKAVPYLESAYKLDPLNLPIVKALSQINTALGHEEEAAKYKAELEVLESMEGE